MEGVKKSGRGGSGKWSKGRRGDERKRGRRKGGWPTSKSACRDDRDVQLGDGTVVGAGSSDHEVGAKVRARNEGLEADGRILDGWEVMGEEFLYLLVSSDAPERPSRADVVVSKRVVEATVCAVVVLPRAEGADVETGGHFGWRDA
jgi:hypothetical protein